MRISVILTTYNAPDFLEKVLYGYSIQDWRDFDLVVADDGSTDETRARIERLGPELALRIRHVWHEDRGFRKCEILNQAILATDAEYLIFSDADCIPRADFVSTHAALAAPGRFLSGGYYKLTEEASRAITREVILANRACDPRLLRGQMPAWDWKLQRMRVGPRLGRLLDALTPTGATWNGHNASCWRSEILRVNGFDERMKYGGLDRELGERLTNAGVRGVQIRHRAFCVHLWHGRPYRREADLARNRAIRDETARTRATFTPWGIVKDRVEGEPPRRQGSAGGA